MKDATLCLLIDGNEIILGRKKRGFGVGKLNGYGGKLNGGETVEEAAVRELNEEAGVFVNESQLEKVGKIEFYFPPGEKADKYNQRVHIYIIRNWVGSPRESEEMTVEKFPLSGIPYDEMWETDRHWMPVVLSGKRIIGRIDFNDDCETTKKFDYREVEGFS